jgi:hypothetical protein
MRAVKCIWISAIGVDQHLLVVALDGEEPWLTEEFQAVQRPFASVNEITDSNDTIDCAIKIQSLQALIELNSLEVDVAYDEVATNVVWGESQDFLGHACGILNHRPPTGSHVDIVRLEAFGANPKPR